MRIFKTRAFAKRAASCGLSDEQLLNCIREFDEGLTGDALGSNLYKKRASIPGRGKRGGLRTILLYQDSTERVFCLHVFIKSAKSNLTLAELDVLKKLGKECLQFTTKQINTALKTGYLTGIAYNDDKKDNGEKNTKHP